MFGIDDLLLASLVGGGLGAVTNKKNPLKGALMGAGMGAVGGGLLGAGSAGGMFSQAAAPIGNVTGQGAAATAASMGLPAQQAAQAPGLLGMAKEFGPIANTGMQAANMFKQPEQPLPPPPQVPIPVGGPQALSQLSGSLQQMGANTEQERMMREARRRQLISQIGGGYGRSFG